MGQYYKILNIDKQHWITPSRYDCGIKLMEHSWVGNRVVGTVMMLMLPGGIWHKTRTVWAGDYYGWCDSEVDYYKQASGANEIITKEFMDRETQKKVKLVNHTKKLYIRYDEMPDKNGWIINPLPLMTALGNGRGGVGDYYDQYPDFEKVGIWAGDVLSIEMTVPKSQWYKKLIVGFKE